MSNWKVSIEEIKLLPHPDPAVERLELAKLGSYQVVVQRGIHRDGNRVVFIPEKSVLPPYIQKEFESYLAGPEKNRVKSVRLKGELSCGVILPLEFFSDKDLSSVEVGTDISSMLGVSKYEPPIPVELSGTVRPIESGLYGQHDCEQFSVYSPDFVEGERVVVTEKLHGTQGIYYLDRQGRWCSSKGLLKQGLMLVESDTNYYWLAAKKTDLWDKMQDLLENSVASSVQVFGEVLPSQKGYSYGFDAPSVLVFDVRIDGREVPYDSVPVSFKELWVPVIYDGPFDAVSVRGLSTGMETVSGKSLHIREGVVVRPYVDRRAEDGVKLRAKIINPKYKETGEEIN
jgi:RNA ligase (TIGR02306 family)